MASQHNRDSFAIPDPATSLSDESSSIVSTTSLDQIPPTSPAYHTMQSDRITDRQSRQDDAEQHGHPDQRQHASGQPLPPGSTTMSSSPTAPFNLSEYARSMLQHTKQQMDATSASPPPAHIHVAGPIGHSQHQHRRRHGHSESRSSETTVTLPNGVAASHGNI